jgi:6-phosphofructokinase
MARKGNLAVGQSGGPTAVINNSLVGVIHEAMQHKEIDGIYGMLNGIRGVIKREFIDLRRESAATIQTLRDTPSAALGTVRYKVRAEEYDPIIDVLQAYDVRYFIYIGGNDSADTSYRIHLAAQRRGYELYVLGVPKTVDNDLAVTDHCPGYGSAARFVAAAIRDTGLDTQAMGESGPVKLVEIMGRNAGWLTASAVLAKEAEGDPPHLIYVPERPVSAAQIADDVRAACDQHGYCVAAISEGLLNEDGIPFGEVNAPGFVDAFGHVAKGGVVEVIAEIIREHVDLRARFDKPGYLQRSFAGLQSSTDRQEAYEVGRAAVRAAVAGHSGEMVTLEREPGPVYACTTGLTPLERIANVERLLPDEFIKASNNGVTEAFVAYARPLIGEPLRAYARLTKHALPSL